MLAAMVEDDVAGELKGEYEYGVEHEGDDDSKYC